MTLEPVVGDGQHENSACPPGGLAGDAEARRLMVLRLGTRWFSVEVLSVVEVAPRDTITRVPTAPSHILGIACLGGRLVTVVSLEQMIGGTGLLSSENVATPPRLVVLRHGEYELAVVAEGIHGIAEHRNRGQTYEEPNSALPEFVREELDWDGHRVAVLDVPRLVAAALKLSGVDVQSNAVEA